MFLQLSVQTLLSFDHVSFNNRTYVMSFVLSIIFMILVVGIILSVPIFICVNYRKLFKFWLHLRDSVGLNTKWSPYFGDMKFKILGYLYNFFFVVRWVLYAFMIVYFRFTILGQCITFLILTVSIFLYQLILRPFNSCVLNFLMTINELVLVVNAVFFFFFRGTD